MQPAYYLKKCCTGRTGTWESKCDQNVSSSLIWSSDRVTIEQAPFLLLIYKGLSQIPPSLHSPSLKKAEISAMALGAVSYDSIPEWQEEVPFPLFETFRELPQAFLRSVPVATYSR